MTHLEATQSLKETQVNFAASLEKLKEAYAKVGYDYTTRNGCLPPNHVRFNPIVSSAMKECHKLYKRREWFLNWISNNP